MPLRLADGREWHPRWTLDPTRTTAVLSLPTRPHPAALMLDAPSIEALVLTLAEARGAMLPKATLWRTEPVLMRVRALWLAL